MKLSHQEHGPICVLKLSGECTAEDVDAFRRAVGERLAGGARHMLLDCEHLDFVDSAGLESWLRLREEVTKRGGQFRLIKPDDNVGTILRLTRLERSFEVHPTLESAVRSVR
jgi:anti-sigma B factor antagonist